MSDGQQNFPQGSGGQGDQWGGQNPQGDQQDPGQGYPYQPHQNQQYPTRPYPYQPYPPQRYPNQPYPYQGYLNQPNQQFVDPQFQGYPNQEHEEEPAKKMSGLTKALIIIVAVAIVGVLGFFAYEALTGSDEKPDYVPSFSTSPYSGPKSASSNPSASKSLKQVPTASPSESVDWPPSGATQTCGDGLMVNGVTSCPFADNVKRAYDREGDGTVNVYSPTTGQDYQMNCTTHDGVGLCTGGNNASVWIRNP